MNTKVISINTHTDQEEAALTIQKYGFTAMPVVDNENRMVGIITVDDVETSFRKRQQRILRRWQLFCHQINHITR